VILDDVVSILRAAECGEVTMLPHVVAMLMQAILTGLANWRRKFRLEIAVKVM